MKTQKKNKTNTSKICKSKQISRESLTSTAERSGVYPIGTTFSEYKCYCIEVARTELAKNGLNQTIEFHESH